MNSLTIVFKLFLILNVLHDYGSHGTPVKYSSDLSDITRYAGQFDIPSEDYFVIRYKKDGKPSDFSYDHANPNSPDKWSDFAPDCGGKLQSPINIKTTSMKKAIIRAKMSGTKWQEKPTKIEVENNGHTIKFEFEYADGERPLVSLNNAVYEFAQLHFHFGQNKKSSGSEHLINNRGYAMEGHAVLFNRDYETFENALKYENGVAVLGKFYETGVKPILKINFDFLDYVRGPDEKFMMEKPTEMFSLQNIFGNVNFSHYSYKGSLTTPMCNEVVSWYLGEIPLGITNKALSQFRKLNGHEGKMGPNSRPVQPRNGRDIFYYKV